MPKLKNNPESLGELLQYNELQFTLEKMNSLIVKVASHKVSNQAFFPQEKYTNFITQIHNIITKDVPAVTKSRTIHPYSKVNIFARISSLTQFTTEHLQDFTFEELKELNPLFSSLLKSFDLDCQAFCQEIDLRIKTSNYIPHLAVQCSKLATLFNESDFRNNSDYKTLLDNLCQICNKTSTHVPSQPKLQFLLNFLQDYNFKSISTNKISEMNLNFAQFQTQLFRFCSKNNLLNQSVLKNYSHNARKLLPLDLQQKILDAKHDKTTNPSQKDPNNKSRKKRSSRTITYSNLKKQWLGPVKQIYPQVA